MNELVKIIDNEPLVSTLDIWEPLEVAHRAIIQLIRKYEKEFSETRLLTFEMSIKKRQGAPTPYCYLDEEQATFLITLMKNSDKVVSFKRRLTKEFYKQRRMLARIANQHHDAQWIEARSLGKTLRVQETTVIQKFVEYATAQGSKNAQRYYCNISKMENAALFFLEQKFTNLRDVLDLSQLMTVSVADRIVSKALKEGMELQMNYKDIYIMAKERIENFAELNGKTIIPAGQMRLASVSQPMLAI